MRYNYINIFERNEVIIVIMTLFSFSCIAVEAQSQDFQTRLGVEVSGDVIDDLGWSAAVQQRWKDNSTTADRTVLQGEIDYSLLSFLKIGAGYRASFVKELNGNNSFKQRLHTDAAFYYRLERFKFLYRSRFQYGFNDFLSNSTQNKKAFVWRHRFEVKYYPFGFPLRPSFSTELFQDLNTPDDAKLKGVRYILGADYLLNRHFSLGLKYILNKELNEADPLTENILFVGVAYEF